MFFVPRSFFGGLFFVCLLLCCIFVQTSKCFFMKEIVSSYRYWELAEDDFDESVRKLVEAAKEASCRAYAPYSKFQVGAAVLLANGKIVTGNNQENGAYPSGLCAERTALFAAGANYPDVAVAAIAIAAQTEGEFLKKPITPCGACRQVMQESEARAGSEMQIILYGTDKTLKINGVRTLLPFSFELT